MKLSVVIPIYNDEKTIGELLERLDGVFQKIKEETKVKEFEVILVDDGSRDKSWEKIKEGITNYDFLKGIKLSRNFGQHYAILAGFDNATGDLLVLMDSDLQDPPEDIIFLVQKILESDFEIVWVKRKKRKDSFFVKVTSWLFYFLFSKIAKIHIPENVGAFAIFTRKVIDEYKKHRERARLHVGIVSYLGFKTTYIELEREESKRGFTNYSFWKRMKLAIFGMVSFSKSLLRISTFTGFSFSLFAFILATYYLIRKLFFSIPVPGYASLIVAMAFFSGIQLLILGIIGEYLGVVMDEVKRRELYIVDKIIYSEKVEEKQ